MPLIEVNTEKIFYDQHGNRAKPQILLIHGSGGDHSHWPVELRRLEGAAVIALDLPGHGRSSGQGRDRVDAYASVIDAFVGELNLARVVLVGHSLGGAIAQHLALKAPGWLSRLVLVGTGARLRVLPDIINGIVREPEATIDEICQWAYGPKASASLVDAGRRKMMEIPPTVIHGDFHACDHFDLMDTVDQIRFPTLVVSAFNDKLTPPKYGEYLCARISGAIHVIIQDAGHMMALEQPVAFTKHIADFVGKNPEGN